MTENPDVVPRSAILQSITTEASGFYTTITSVASAFLGASLLFADKFQISGGIFSLVMLAVSWILLVASIGCVARVRFLNLKSGQLALQDKFNDAAAIDIRSWRFSTLAQWLLIAGMVALVIVGLANVNNFVKKEDPAMSSPKGGNPQKFEKTIPYGSLKPQTNPIQQTSGQTATQTSVSTSQPSNQPKK
ncbi:MAG: hypothetical protein ABFD89_15170 [Bryobacteraceae bacterium]